MAKTKTTEPLTLEAAIRAARGAARLTQKQAAAQLDAPAYLFHQWEQGRPVSDEYRDAARRWALAILPGIIID